MVLLRPGIQFQNLLLENDLRLLLRTILAAFEYNILFVQRTAVLKFCLQKFAFEKKQLSVAVSKKTTTTTT